MVPNAIEMCRDWISKGLLTVPPRQAALILGCKPYSLNLAAQQGRLRLPHTFVGNRLRISTVGLLNFISGRGVEYVGRHEKMQMDMGWDNTMPDPLIPFALYADHCANTLTICNARSISVFLIFRTASTKSRYSGSFVSLYEISRILLSFSVRDSSNAFWSVSMIA